MSDKIKKYLRIFRAEADEHLKVISKRLLELEQGTADAEAINDLLRAAHTLKGSARMVGLLQIGDVAHKMEDIMKAVQTGGMPGDAVVVDRMLEGADAIVKLMEAEGDPNAVDVSAVIERLTATMGPGADPGPAAPPTPELIELKPPPAAPPATPPAETPAPAPAAAGHAGDEDERKPKPAAKPAPAAEAKKAADTVRVPAERLDRLIDFSGELLISKIKLENKSFVAKQMLEAINDLVGGFESLSGNGRPEALKRKFAAVRDQCQEFAMELAEDVIELDFNAQEIQSGSLQLRMTPVSLLFDEFPRLVRDLGRDLEKDIHLEIRGQETEVDKRLLEQLRGPLIHLIRNACDHGVEAPAERERIGKPRQGRVVLDAYHQGASVIISVEDDGAGMDPGKIRRSAVTRGLLDEVAAAELTDEETYYLTLRPGFSTSEIITDFSGRGVGMDVVKTNVEALRGDIHLASTPGRGARIELILPLTVSIIEALLISQGGEIYAIPLPAVEEVIRMTVSSLVTERGRESAPVHGQLLPLVRLGDLLGLDPLPGHARRLESTADVLTLVVLKFRNQKIALEVDAAMREQDILVKNLGLHLRGARLVSGATILRKGEPALIVDVADVFEDALRVEAVGIKEQVSVREEQKRPPRILVVDDSITTRTIEKNILERAGYDVVTAVSAEDGLERLETTDLQFELFVVDIDMPGMNGFELTKKLRSDPRTAERPVIIVTSRASDEDKRQGILVGAQAYIVKGAFDQNVLLDTVKSLIGE